MIKKEISVSLDPVMTGHILNHMVRKRGYAVSDIQEELKLSCPQPIYRWFNGRTMPSIDNLYRLSRVLDAHMEDLVVPMQDEVWIKQCDPPNLHMLRRLKKYCRAYLRLGFVGK